MALDIGPTDFLVMLTDLGRTIERRPRTASTRDSLGELTYTLGALENLTAIVQDIGEDELKQLAGILEVGDRTLFVAGTVTIEPTDELTIDAEKYRTVTEVSPAIGDTPTRPYREYVVRKVPM